jgi:hypothetical protein
MGRNQCVMDVTTNRLVVQYVTSIFFNFREVLEMPRKMVPLR